MPRAGNCASAMFPDESLHGPELCLLIHHRFEWKWAMGGGIVRLRASCEAGIGRRKRLPHRGKGAQGRAFLENRPALREDRSLTVAAPIGAATVRERSSRSAGLFSRKALPCAPFPRWGRRFRLPIPASQLARSRTIPPPIAHFHSKR